MGITYMEGMVRSSDEREAPVRFLIDSGATYSLLPQPVWRALGLGPKREMEFVLADGTAIRRGMSECYVVLSQGDGHTPVILGEPDDEALLGVVTLEILGLVFNPFNRTLQQMRMHLA